MKSEYVSDSAKIPASESEEEKGVRQIRRLPAAYLVASLRNVTPFDDVNRAIGVGFNLPDGSVVRMSLSVECAKCLAESLSSYLLGYVARTHSAISSEIPSVDVSTPEE